MDQNNYIDIKKEDFIKILSEYYSKKLKKDITLNYRVNIIWNDNLSLNIFFEKRSQSTKHIINLNDEDIHICLEAYAKNKGLELDNFKYLGSIKPTGYFLENNAPCFEGIRLYFKEKAKTLIKK